MSGVLLSPIFLHGISRLGSLSASSPVPLLHRTDDHGCVSSTLTSLPRHRFHSRASTSPHDVVYDLYSPVPSFLDRANTDLPLLPCAQPPAAHSCHLLRTTLSSRCLGPCDSLYGCLGARVLSPLRPRAFRSLTCISASRREILFTHDPVCSSFASRPHRADHACMSPTLLHPLRILHLATGPTRASSAPLTRVRSFTCGTCAPFCPPCPLHDCA